MSAGAGDAGVAGTAMPSARKLRWEGRAAAQELAASDTRLVRQLTLCTVIADALCLAATAPAPRLPPARLCSRGHDAARGL